MRAGQGETPKAKEVKTIGQMFRIQLKGLMETLEKSSTMFVHRPSSLKHTRRRRSTSSHALASLVDRIRTKGAAGNI